MRTRPREAKVHRCAPVLWPDATSRWASVDRGGCGPREQARLIHLRGASRALRESMESSGESADEALTQNMHLAAALVGSERVEAQCPSPEERAGPRSCEYVRASYGPRFHRAVRMSEPCFEKLVHALRPHLPSSPHRVQSRSVLRRLHPLLSVPLGHPLPAAGPLTERKRNKRADGGGTHSSWMRLIQNRPMQQVACSLCACLARVHRYRPLL